MTSSVCLIIVVLVFGLGLELSTSGALCYLPYRADNYEGNFRQLHDKLFNGPPTVDTDRMLIDLTTLHINQRTHGEPTLVDTLVNFANIKADKCTGLILKTIREAVVQLSATIPNFIEYLSHFYEEQKVFCKNLLISEITIAAEQIPEEAQADIRLFMQIRESIQLDYLRENTILDLISAITMGKMGNLNNVLGAGVITQLPGVLKPIIKHLEDSCKIVEAKLTSKKALISIIVELPFGEITLAHPHIREWLSWVRGCKDLLEVYSSLSLDEIEEWVRHSVYRVDDYEAWARIAGNKAPVVTQWLTLKKDLYQKRVARELVPSIDIISYTINRLIQMATSGELGEFQFMATSYEPKFAQLANVSELKCKTSFPKDFKLFQTRFSEYNIIMTYLDHFWRLQVDVCLAKFRQNLDEAVGGAPFSDTDLNKLLQLRAFQEERVEPTIKNRSLQLSSGFIKYFDTSDLQSDEAKKAELDRLRALCRRIQNELSPLIATYKSITKTDKEKLDEQSIAWMKAADTCEKLRTLHLSPYPIDVPTPLNRYLGVRTAAPRSSEGASSSSMPPQ